MNKKQKDNHHEAAGRQLRVFLAVCMQRAAAEMRRRHDRAVRVAQLRAKKQRERGQSDG